MAPILQRMLAAALAGLIAVRFYSPSMVWVMSIGALAFSAMIALGMRKLSETFGEVPGGHIDSMLSREAAFVANNWVLLAMQLFVVVATVFPLISQAVSNEEVTVGPAFYNRWMVPLGLVLFALMGIGPLLGWRKTSDTSLRRAFRVPLIATGAFMALHLAIGRKLGFPAFVESDAIYPGVLGAILKKVGGVAPWVCGGLVVFNIVVVAQEYQRGIVARMRGKKEGFLTAVRELVTRNKKRYGGYIVHVGIALMFLGFLGSAYKTEQEVVMHPGETVSFSGYDFTYLREHRDVDAEKMMVFTDVLVKRNGKPIATMKPAHFIYTRMQQTTSEVAILPGAMEDVYIAPGNVNPQTKAATLHIHVNPLTSWIWLGVIVLIFGASIATWPEAALGEVGVAAYLRSAGATAASLVFGLLLAMTPARAYAAQGTPVGGSDMAGYVEMHSEAEKSLFPQLLCQCGCSRLPLSGCTCEWAEGMRNKLARRLEAGESIDSIKDDYVRQFGVASLNVPPSRGFLRSIWLVPSVLILAGGFGAFVLVRRWNVGAKADKNVPTASSNAAAEPGDEYDAKLDEALKNQNDDR